MTPSPPDLQAREAGPYARHIPALDGIRGLAILAVMASHLFPGSHTGPPVVRAFEALFPFGASGVDLFFVLSGFLITGILYDSLSDHRFFRKFYARRALRIFPLYYGVLLIAFLLTPWLGIAWHGMLWSLALYLQNTTLLAEPLATFNFGPINFAHFWSLAVEEQFYLVWPLCVFFVRQRRRLLWICVGVSVVSILLRFGMTIANAPFQVIHTTTLCRADSLLIGGALALLLRGRHHDTILRAGRWLFVVAAAFALIIGLPPLDQGAHPLVGAAFFTAGYTLKALASAGLVIWSLAPSWPQRFFQSTLLRFFGKYSYGLYVLHVVALPTMLPLFRSWMQHVTTNKGLVVAGAGLMALGASVIAAYLSFHLYEKQFLKLKRYFDYKQKPSSAVLPEADPAKS